MTEETIKTLSEVSDAVVTKEITIEMSIAGRTRLHRWLQKKGWLPDKKKYLLKPITLGNLIRISRLLLSINPDAEQLRKRNFLDISYQTVMEHSETVLKVCAIAITNTKAEPGKGLIDELRHNLTAKELMVVLTMTLQQMDISTFMHSIILIRGLNVLEREEKKNEPSEVSPESQGR